MNHRKADLNTQKVNRAVLSANMRLEKVEVLLRNLLALKHPEEDGFKIPDEDVYVTLETAIDLLSERISL